MRQDERPIAVDLFCGAGGMSLGFEQAGFRIAAAVDLDPIHVGVHEHNFPDCRSIQADLALATGEELRTRAGLHSEQIDVLFGGPPCQGFSMIGQRQATDPRSELLLHFGRLVGELKPSYFVMENVEGLLMGRARSYLHAFVEGVGRDGYSVVQPIKVLDASEFGVPQRRRRVFVLGYRRDMTAPTYPNKPVSFGMALAPKVWDAIGDLPNVGQVPELLVTDIYERPLGEASVYARYLRGELRDPEDLSLPRPHCHGRLTGCAATAHTATTRRRFAETRPGTYESVTHFYRLERRGLAPTLRAGTDKTRGSYMAPRPIHPTQARCITVREAARLHSLPDWFQLHSTKWHGFRQIGNAVPPLLARAVAFEVAHALEGSSIENNARLAGV